MSMLKFIRQNYKTLLATIAILFCELLERLTYYGIIANFVLYLGSPHHLGFSDAEGIVINGLFTGFVYLIPIFGGYVADTFTGRFHAIWGSLAIYVVGAMFLPLSAIPSEPGLQVTFGQETRRALFFVGLVFIALGTGGIKSNVSPFGAMQVDTLGPSAVQSFFNWFYWFINVGSAIAFLAVAYVQQSISFFYGNLIILCSIFLGIVVFLLPIKVYKMDRPKESALARVFRIIIYAIRRKRSNPIPSISWLDHARERCGGMYSDEHVNEVIGVGKVIPIFTTFIVYWTLYNQMSNTFYIQGVRMDLTVTPDFQIPVASLNVFNTVIILIASPIMDKIIYPLYKKCTSKDVPQFPRIALGYVLMALALVIAAILEILRKKDMEENGSFRQTFDNLTFINASHLTIFYQVPQYTVIGLSEIFASVTGLEFAFSESPATMKSIVMGLFLFTSGLGSWLSSILLIIVNSASTTFSETWIPKDVNDGYMEYFCFLLAALMIPNLCLLLYLSRWYRKKEEEDFNIVRKGSVAVINPGYVDDDQKPISVNNGKDLGNNVPMEELTYKTPL